MKLALHIGTPKTGTTTLQRWFAQNRTALQAQGVPISYDPVYDEFNVGLTDTRPKAARKVHMDQISAPERGIGATGMDQVRR